MNFAEIRDRVSHLDMYSYIITFLAILVLINIFNEGILSTLPQVAIAIATALAIGIPLKYLKKKEWKISRSAIITGLLVGSVLAPGQMWYVPMIASAIAILSKHILRLTDKQVFNPAAFGIILVQLIFGVSTGWWASIPLYLVAAFGLLQMWKMRNYYQISSFLVSMVIISFILTRSLTGIQSVLLNSTLLFFMFFMFTEPKTSPYNRSGKILYGAIIAVLIFVTSTYLATIQQLALLDPYLSALLIGNMSVPLLRRFVK